MSHFLIFECLVKTLATWYILNPTHVQTIPQNYTMKLLNQVARKSGALIIHKR